MKFELLLPLQSCPLIVGPLGSISIILNILESISFKFYMNQIIDSDMLPEEKDMTDLWLSVAVLSWNNKTRCQLLVEEHKRKRERQKTGVA